MQGVRATARGVAPAVQRCSGACACTKRSSSALSVPSQACGRLYRTTEPGCSWGTPAVSVSMALIVRASSRLREASQLHVCTLCVLCERLRLQWLWLEEAALCRALELQLSPQLVQCRLKDQLAIDQTQRHLHRVAS